jgi:penicillin-binding protein 1C
MRLRLTLRGSTLRIAAAALLAVLLTAPPPPSKVLSYDAVHRAWQPSEAYLLDRRGEPIHQLRVDFSARRLDWVPLEEISPVLVQAVLHSEDRRFASHHGVDWAALAAAAAEYLAGGRRGASTVSMQLAALLGETRVTGGARRTIAEKLQQIGAALELEQSWSKNQILEAYFNLLTYRGELRGIGAAARGLFKKHPSGLTEAESLLLAAMLPSPQAAAERVARRACAIARAGRSAISCARLQQLARESLSGAADIALAVELAPHLAQRMHLRPGESLVTTLDAPLQQFVVDALGRQIMGLDGQNVRDGAAVVVENASGKVLAYVGSSAVHSQAPHVDGVRAYRQAGSTLKPFLYGLAIERGYLTAASLIDDSPINIETAAGMYIPQDYDRDFKGIVSVRTALASSLNVPAVRTLVLTGLDDFYGRLGQLGYQGLHHDAEHYGYALALGSAEVSLLEQVNAYRTLANGGVWSPLRFAPGDAAQAGRRVTSRAAAFVISDILSDRAGRSLTFGLSNPLATRFWSAVKTGTSKNMRDNWCIGYSREYSVAVWVGNFEGDPMWDVSGVTGAAPLWLEIMNFLHAARPSEAPPQPLGIAHRRVRFEPAVEPERNEWFLAGTEAAVVRLLSPGAAAPRIEYPANGMILAIDPDIPEAHQSVVFQASLHSPAMHWVLDGADRGAAAAPMKWTPLPGRHVLALVDDAGRALDEVRFQVRGRADARRSD